LNIRRRGAAIGFTATLLASMIAVVAAPLAFATVSVTSAGVVPDGGTSTSPASFTICENAGGSWAAGGTISVTITPAAPGAGTVTFTNATGGAPAPTVTAPGALGASAVATGNVLTIHITSDDGVNALCVTVGNLFITASTTASTGAIVATLNAAATDTLLPATYTPATTTATGTLATSQAAGATSFLVNVSSACPFVAQGTAPGPAGDFIINGTDSGAGGTAAALVAGQQILTTAAFGSATTAGQAVTQALVPNCATTTIGSPGTVAAALTQTTTNTTINPGETNQVGGTLTLSEAPSGTGTDFTGLTITFAISAPAAGVQYSASPIATPTGGLNLGGGLGVGVPCTINVARTACSVTVTADAAGADSITLSGTGGGINFDVASTVPLGTAVKITASTSPTYAVVLSSTTVAFVGRVIVGTAAQPVIFIGFNDQATGQMTLAESGPGFFQAGPGPNDAFSLCLENVTGPGTGESFTRAPWAVVTVGDLKLLSAPSTAVTQIKGTLFTDADGESCAYWTIYSASTVASTIEIRGSADDVTPLATGPNSGPRLSVGLNMTPGTTQSEIAVGTLAAVQTDGGALSLVSNAIRAFKNSVTVAATSQPNCAPGTTDCLLGNVIITETQNGQFKPGQTVFGWILPRSSTLRNDVKILASNTNQLPIITTNAASGLLVSNVSVICPSVIPLLQICAFTFTVTQQSFGPAFGQITISNMHATVTPDAVLGPIQTEWSNSASSIGISVPSPITGQVFDSIVTNGNVAPPAGREVISADSSATGGAPFTTTSKILAKGQTITLRFRTSPQLAGRKLGIWMEVQVGGVWGALKPHASVVTYVNGVAIYTYKTTSAVKIGFQAKYAGDATHAAAASLPFLFGLWH